MKMGIDMYDEIMDMSDDFAKTSLNVNDDDLDLTETEISYVDDDEDSDERFYHRTSDNGPSDNFAEIANLNRQAELFLLLKSTRQHPSDFSALADAKKMHFFHLPKALLVPFVQARDPRALLDPSSLPAEKGTTRDCAPDGCDCLMKRAFALRAAPVII